MTRSRMALGVICVAALAICVGPLFADDAAPPNPLKVLKFGSCCVTHWCMTGSRMIVFACCVRGSVWSLAVGRRVALLTSLGGCGGLFDWSDIAISEPSDL